jgi:uncharacterized protein (TIGR04145 family)
MKRSFFRTLIIILIIITIPFPVFADYGPIQIDSHYDDWEDKPHMEVYPGNNPPGNKINHVSLFRDESNGYVHVIFAYSNNQGIKNMTIDLKTNLGNKDFSLVSDSIIPDSFEEDIDMDDLESSGEQNLFANGVKEDIFLVAENENNSETTETQDTAAGQEIVTEPADQNGSNDPEEGAEPTDQDPGADSGIGTDLIEENSNDNSDDLPDLFDPDTITDDFDTDLEELEPNMNQKKPTEYGTWAFSVMDGDVSVGSGYYTRSEGEPDELELYIPLSSITQQYDGITEISMAIKKLGKQEIFCVGASTAPYLGIAVGAGIAMLSVGVYTFRKRKQC